MTLRSTFVSAGALAAALLAATPAFAAGTTAGSSINNTATLNYSVGGVAQTAVSSNTATFVVDRKISMTLTEPGNATTSVSPGAVNQVTTFLLTNTSNAALDFGLALAQPAGGTAAHGGTDNFDVTVPTFWINTGPSVGSATYDPANSTPVTYIDELAADATKYIFVLATVPITRVSGDVAGVTLTAQARASGTAGTQGAVVTETAGANTAAMDTVFADAAGATDAARDGQISARDDYTVSAATLTITKTSKVISDPQNGTTNPKLIPGAVVEYCIQVANAAGGATAQAPSVSDVVPAQTTYDATFGIKLNGTVTAGVCNADGTTGGTYTAGTTTVSGTLSDVAAGATRTLYFRATIN
ncbi:hypothetical protein [Sphingomonas sp. SUN039]|uniref:hypothetical protein n=1 Tax=Sphingomonas sp. SUN039 TaxID=2937787 RepID=UPI002164DABF|nr:hypothetical protein [Sphingomonas sp. SUN039]UVO53151.1 hypothetical protein M0209_03065 [Sphingomonas sp. SUN039]